MNRRASLFLSEKTVFYSRRNGDTTCLFSLNSTAHNGVGGASSLSISDKKRDQHLVTW